MWGLPLHVEDLPSLVHHNHQVNEGHLRSISGHMKHRLSGKQASYRHTVETADEFSIAVPHLDRMGPSHPMQLGVGIDDVLGDPAVGAVDIGTAPDHRVEVLIDGDQVAACRLTKGARDPQPVEREDGPVDR